MSDLTILMTQLSGFLAIALLLSGCALLHLRLRRCSTWSLLGSLAALVAYTSQGHSLIDTLPAFYEAIHGPPQNDFDRISSVGFAQTIDHVIESLLMLWVGASFFFSVKSIRTST